MTMKTFLKCSECGNYLENNFSERQICVKCGAEIISNIQNLSELKNNVIRKFKQINLFAVGIFVVITLIVYLSSLIYAHLQTKLYRSSSIIKLSLSDIPIIDSDKITSIFFDNVSELIKSKELMIEVINNLGLIDQNANERELDNVYNNLIQRIDINRGINKNENDNIVDLSVFITITSIEPKKATRIINEIISEFEIRNDELLDLINEKVKLSYYTKINYHSDKMNFLKTEIEKTQKEKQDAFIRKINLETLGNDYKSNFELLKNFEFEIQKLDSIETEFDFIKAQIPTKYFYPNIRQSGFAGLVIGIFFGLLITYYITRI